MKSFNYKLESPFDCEQNIFYRRIASGFLLAICFFALLNPASGQTFPGDPKFSPQSVDDNSFPAHTPNLFRLNNWRRNSETAKNQTLPPSQILNPPTVGGLDPSFNPPTLQTYPGYANASAVQTDGKIIIGGYFSVINGLSKRNLVRFNVDGTLDASFNANVNADVTAVAIQPDGKIFISGYFSSINNINSYVIARLNSDGSLDTSFTNSIAIPASLDIAIQPDGKIIIVGYSTEIIRLNSDGSRDTSFIASVDINVVNAVTVQPDGKILIGGFFFSVDNTPGINAMARLNTDGSVDTSFNANLNSSSNIREIVLQTDGRILISGGIYLFGGNEFRGIARLNSNGSLDSSFSSSNATNGAVITIAVIPNGKILIGGSFSVYNGEVRNSIALLNSNGTLDTSFNSVLSDVYVSTVKFLPNNKIFAGGYFTLYDGVNRDTGARLNADGSLDSSLLLTSLSPANVRTSITQPDGKTIVGGYFNRVNGTNTYSNLIRLNADGTVDSNFNTGSVANSTVNAIVLQPDGKIIIGGNFYNQIARLNSDGSLDNSFNTANKLRGGILSLVLQPDGKIVISGSFSFNNGNTYPGIGRLDNDGSIDNSFNPGTGANTQINNVSLQVDGKILIGGYFNQVDGINYYGIARLNANGSIDPSFASPTTQNTSVEAIALQPDGKILIGGQIFNANNPAGGIARLNANGSVDISFGNGSGFIESYILDIALQSNGKILIGGFIDSINGIPRNDLARLNSDGSLDTAFNIAVDDSVRDISLTDNGQGATIAGSFISVNGIPHTGLARVLLTSNARTQFDFDGDGRTDYGVFRPSNNSWYLARSTQGFAATQFGIGTDNLTPADYDGDGKTDVAVFRDGNWYVSQSSNNQVRSIAFGQAGDVPVPADYDGDGKADVAVFRQGIWYLTDSSNNQFRSVQFGNATDKAVPADYDGDGKTDVAVFRDGNWYYLQSSDNSFRAVVFGVASDKAVPADYDGDGRADQAVYRNGVWYLNRSTQGFLSVQFGATSDAPTVGDYDGDGRADLAIWRGTNGIFYLLRSNDNQFVSFQWGVDGDAPVAAVYIR